MISTVLMAVLYSPVHDPSRVYYGSDTHGAPILLGAALALARANALRNRSKRGRRHRVDQPSNTAADVAALAGAAVLAYFMVKVGYLDGALYRGGFLFVAVAASLVLLAAIRGGSLTARALGGSGLRWIGLRSYAIYLWHWPIIQLTRPDLHPPMSGLALDVLRVTLTVVAAAVSYRFVEVPIRQRGLLAFISRPVTVQPDQSRGRRSRSWRSQPA